MTSKMEDRLKTAISLVVKCGNFLKENYGISYIEKQKESKRDIVTELDISSEKIVLDKLNELYPEDSTLSEELGYFRRDETSLWIIDALDGTVNFINNIPVFCVSIAYWKNYKPLIGAVYNPISSELYYASNEIGAFLNQKKISFTHKNCDDVLSAMSFSGKAFSKNDRHKEFNIFGAINDITRGCLRTGSAGLNLCYLSQSRLGICLGKANKLWDVAAGFVIATQSGAKLKYNIIDPKSFLVDFIAGSEESIKYLSSNLDLSYLKLY